MVWFDKVSRDGELRAKNMARRSRSARILPGRLLAQSSIYWIRRAIPPCFGYGPTHAPSASVSVLHHLELPPASCGARIVHSPAGKDFGAKFTTEFKGWLDGAETTGQPGDGTNLKHSGHNGTEVKHAGLKLEISEKDLAAAGIPVSIILTPPNVALRPSPMDLPAAETAAPAPSLDVINPTEAAGPPANASFTKSPVLMTTAMATPITASPLVVTPFVSTPFVSHVAANEAPAISEEGALSPVIRVAETPTEPAINLAEESAAHGRRGDWCAETERKSIELTLALPPGTSPAEPPASFADAAPKNTAGPPAAIASREPILAKPVPADPLAPSRRLSAMPSLSSPQKKELLKPLTASHWSPVWEQSRSEPSSIPAVDVSADSVPASANESKSTAAPNFYPGGRQLETVFNSVAESAGPVCVGGEMAFALRLTTDAAQSNSIAALAPEQPPVSSGSPAPAPPTSPKVFDESSGKIETAPRPSTADTDTEQHSSGGTLQERGRRRPDASIRPPLQIQPGPAENARQEQASPFLHSAEGLKPEPSDAPPARTGDSPHLSSQPAPEPEVSEARAPLPLREFSLSVRSTSEAPAQSDVPRVGLRVRLSGDDVQVAVHTSDPRASEQLRRDLGTLAERLGQSGYHTETWLPGIQSGAAGGAPSRGSDRETGSNPGGTPDEGSPGGRQGEQRQQHRQRPAWVDELEHQKERLS